MTVPSRCANMGAMTRQIQLIRQIRSHLALNDRTQRELGEALGLGHAAMSARMNCHRDFTFSELEAVADFFEVPLRDLLVFEQDKAANR